MVFANYYAKFFSRKKAKLSDEGPAGPKKTQLDIDKYPIGRNNLYFVKPSDFQSTTWFFNRTRLRRWDHFPVAENCRKELRVKKEKKCWVGWIPNTDDDRSTFQELSLYFSLGNQFERFQFFLVNYIVDWNSNFVVVEIIFKKQFDFLCVRSSFTHNVTLHVHMLWPVFRHVLIKCRHTVERKERDRKRDHSTTSQHHYTHIVSVSVRFLRIYMYICA